MTLGFVAAVLCVTLVLAGASIGLTGAFVSAQPSPSGSSPSPGGESGKIFLLNPSLAYDPHFTVTEPPREPSDPTAPTADPDPPKISDKFDGVDQTYHVVAVIKDPPADALIEAYYTPNGQNEVTVGQLSPVPGSDDTFELLWDVSEAALNPGFGTFTVRLFRQTPSGFEEVSADEVPVRLQHESSTNIPEPPITEAQTAELIWPSQNGPIGFYKGAGTGTWQTIVNGSVSSGDTSPEGPRITYQVRLFYSTSPVGTEVEYTSCGDPIGTGTARDDGSRPFIGTCTLQGTDVPSDVTAMAALAVQDQDPDRSGPNTRQPSQEGADAHRVVPYAQEPSEMKLELESQISGSFYNQRRRRLADSDCLTYRLRVKDQFDRPVQGANLDVHVEGPTDQIMFGHDFGTGTPSDNTSQHKNADKGNHSSENAWDCLNVEATGTQSDHNVPGDNDVKHRESTTGSGRSGGGGVSFGEYRFGLYSTDPGITDITAWIDDEDLAVQSEKRPADDDVREPTEVSTTDFAQWLTTGIAVSIDPLGNTAAIGSCARYIVRVRDGNRPVADANVDVHATGPSSDLDFCDPGDGTPRSAPNQGTGHNAEDNGEVSHAGEPPTAQHTEGVTNAQGNFIVGITSPVGGDSTLTAWYDGEETFDNDEFATSESNATATTNWIEGTGDAAVSWLNPSAYGDVTNVARTEDVDDAYHLVARVSSLQPVAGVEFFYQSGDDPLVKIADATRVGQTDAYEAFWPVEVEDGDYTLIARIVGTNTTASQDVTVRNEDDPIDPTTTALETAEITSPLNGDRAAFVRGALTVRGVASAGAEGVTLYYTKTGALTTPGAGAWTECATSTLPAGSAPKEFTLECELAGADQPAMVTGIAALAYNCLQGECDLGPTNDSGDAHRVFGGEANPLLSIEPAETAADVGSCEKFVVTLTDQTGQPIPGQNVDAHLIGPGNSGNFCSPEDGSGTNRRAPDQGSHTPDGDETDEAYHDEGGSRTQHTEAEVTGNGRFVFGIEAERTGDAQVTVWLDADEDDELDQSETTDVSVMHWEAESACDVTGTNGPDVLEGSDSSERICGFGGNDTIRGGGGNDSIIGGKGRDVLRGNGGSDLVKGGPGPDKGFGGAGGDQVRGGGGNDRVSGHRGNDRLFGDAGRDFLNGGANRDSCRGGRGRDRLRKCETGTRSFAARTRPI